MPKLKYPPEKVKLADGTEIEILRTDGAGKVIYLDDSGAEKPGDLISVLGALKNTLDEKATLETRAKAAEDSLAPLKALGTVDEITKALDMTKSLKAGDLKTIDEVRARDKQVADDRDAFWKTQIQAEQQKAEDLKAQIADASLQNICNTVAGLKVKDAMGKEIPVFAAPGEGLHRVFKDHCRQDEKGNWQFSKVAGNFDSSNIILHEFQPAPPEIAFQELAKSPNMSWLLAKPNGGGSGILNDGGGGGGASTMQRSAYLKLHASNPDEARKFTHGGGKVVDDAAA